MITHTIATIEDLGQYGGAAFIIIYIIFLVVLGFPLVTMELAVGRASQRSITRSFDVLEKPGQKWHLIKYPAFTGNYLFQMFYTTVAAWILLYAIKAFQGEFVGETTEQIKSTYDRMIADPVLVASVTGALWQSHTSVSEIQTFSSLAVSDQL